MATLFTDEQLAEIRESFDLFDKDRNGFITTLELGSVLNATGNKVSGKDIKRMIKDYDTDKDGKISFEEFLVIMSDNLNDGGYEESLKKTFQIFDKDGNGFITRSELKQAMSALQNDLTDQDIEDMLIEADLNEDGKIDFEEFMKIMDSK